MKWPHLDESVYSCICLLTVACNREMQPFLLAIRCGGGGGFRIRALDLTVPLGLG